MNLINRRRYLIASQKKKNWFDFSKVTGAANNAYTYQQAYASVSGDKYIAKYGGYAMTCWVYDSRTTLPKGEYILSFTLYAPYNNGLFYTVAKMSSDPRKSIIATYSDWSCKANTHVDYSLQFSLEEETTVILGLQGVGNSSSYLNLNYEFTNICIEKVG